MFPTNPIVESDMRRDDMLREAQKQRLIREAQQANSKSRPSCLRTLAMLLFVRAQ